MEGRNKAMRYEPFQPGPQPGFAPQGKWPAGWTGSPAPRDPTLRVMLSVAVVVLTAVMGVALYYLLQSPASPSSTKLTAGARVNVTDLLVPTDGGTITVSEPGGPVDGLEINVPRGAYGDPRTFKISYAPIEKHEFGTDFTPLTPLITVSNGGGYSAEPMTLTIPLKVPPGYFAMGFLYDERTGELEGMPLLESTSDHVTVSTMNFAHSSASGEPSGENPRPWQAGALYQDAGQLTEDAEAKIVMAAAPESSLVGEFDSGFRPGVDDWQFTNYGSTVAPLGHCGGQSATAMWYYAERKKKKGAPALYGLYDNDGVRKTPHLWQDDVNGYKLASVAQKDYGGSPTFPFDVLQFVGQFLMKDSVTLKAFRYAIKLTGSPQFISIFSRRGGHAIIAYRVSGNTIFVADPNFPGNRDRAIEYDTTTEAFIPYSSGDNAASLDTSYTKILYAGRTSFINWYYQKAHWAAFEQGTIGQGVFPNFSLFALNKDVEFVPLEDGFEVPEGRLTVSVRGMGAYRFHVYNERGERLSKEVSDEDNRETSAVNLPPGEQLVGINVMDSSSRWAGFKWVKVKVGERRPQQCTVSMTVDGASVNVSEARYSQGSWSGIGGPVQVFQLQGSSDKGSFYVSARDFNGAGTYQLFGLNPMEDASSGGWGTAIQFPPDHLYHGLRMTSGSMTISEWTDARVSGKFEFRHDTDWGDVHEHHAATGDFTCSR